MKDEERFVKIVDATLGVYGRAKRAEDRVAALEAENAALKAEVARLHRRCGDILQTPEEWHDAAVARHTKGGA